LRAASTSFRRERQDIVPVAEVGPAATLTVRQELSIQSTYVVDLWPLLLVMVPPVLALASDKLLAGTRPARWWPP